jgi:ATP-binding cassette subfamily F protein 3
VLHALSSSSSTTMKATSHAGINPSERAASRRQKGHTTDAKNDSTSSRLERELELLAIKATSQESRFSVEASISSSASKEIDLKKVNLYIGQKQLLQDAHLRLKEGVHYGLVGRNGTGKSSESVVANVERLFWRIVTDESSILTATALLRALSEGIIPGLPTNIKILLVSQIHSEELLDNLSKSKGSQQTLSVMDAVLQSDVKRVDAEKVVEEVGRALDADNRQQLHKDVSTILLDRAFQGLEEARKISSKRSGARGAVARKELLEAERVYETAKQDSTSDDGQRDWVQEGSEIHQSALDYLEGIDSATVNARAYSVLQGLGFTRKQIEQPYASLSGGWKSKVMLASALLQHCEILALDEPINYLDMPSILWLQKFINSSPVTVVTVAHDVEVSVRV